MLPHELAKRHGNMLSVNQEIPEHLVDSGKAVLCPLLAGQMSVSDESLLLHERPWLYFILYPSLAIARPSSMVGRTVTLVWGSCGHFRQLKRRDHRA